MSLPQETLTNSVDDESNSQFLNEYMSEILVTIPSILLMLKKYDTLDERINEFKKLIEHDIASKIFKPEVI